MSLVTSFQPQMLRIKLEIPTDKWPDIIEYSAPPDWCKLACVAKCFKEIINFNRLEVIKKLSLHPYIKLILENSDAIKIHTSPRHTLIKIQQILQRSCRFPKDHPEMVFHLQNQFVRAQSIMMEESNISPEHTSIKQIIRMANSISMNILFFHAVINNDQQMLATVPLSIVDNEKVLDFTFLKASYSLPPNRARQIELMPHISNLAWIASVEDAIERNSMDNLQFLLKNSAPQNIQVPLLISLNRKSLESMNHLLNSHHTLNMEFNVHAGYNLPSIPDGIHFALIYAVAKNYKKGVLALLSSRRPPTHEMIQHAIQYAKHVVNYLAGISNPSRPLSLPIINSAENDRNHIIEILRNALPDNIKEESKEFC